MIDYFTIGRQCWQRFSCICKTFSNGDEIPAATSLIQWEGFMKEEIPCYFIMI